MKRWKKIVLSAVGLIGISGAVFIIPTVWGKPWVIEHFYARTFLEFVLRHPMLLSQLRILEQMGATSHNAELDDLSVGATTKAMRYVEENIATLHSYDRAHLDDTLSYDVLDNFLTVQMAGKAFMFHDYPMNQSGGIQSGLPDFMVNTHVIDDAEGAEHYVARIAQFDRTLSQILEGVQHRQKLGIEPPRFVLTKVLEEMRSLIEPAPREHILFTHFRDKIEKLEDLSEESRGELRDELARLIEEGVYPGYQRLIDYFAEREPQASTDDGVWKLPDGERFYAWRLRLFTSTDMSADEIHRLGQKEVAALRRQMTTILEAQGYEVDSPGVVIQRLNTEERFLYPDTDAGRKQILDDYKTIIDEIHAGLDPLFNQRPEASVEVKRVPEFKEKTAPGAYYNPAPMDGSRPGVFYANLRSVAEIPKFGMRTLAYHEGIPGHHYQLSIAQELKELPFFRRVIPFTAYTEGWALYAERVAAENGFQKDPFDRLGYLTSEMFRAVRLVVDTGLHHKRWTRQQAIDYMLENTGMPKDDVVAEIERYIVNPGQACAYKVGQLKILELRKRAREALGTSFDIREFHDVALSNGSLPLELLERVVDEWIVKKRA